MPIICGGREVGNALVTISCLSASSLKYHAILSDPLTVSIPNQVSPRSTPS